MASAASRTFDTPMTWTKGVVDYFCKVTLGTSGAVVSLAGYGVASVTRTAAGAYTVVMLDVFPSFLHLGVTIEKTTSGTYSSTAAIAFLQEGNTGNTGTFYIQGINGAGAYADVDTNAAFSLRITYKNSTAF